MNKAGFVFLFSMLASLPVQAQQGAAQPTQPGGDAGQQKFQQTKERLLKALDQRIDRLQKAKSCAEQAQDAQALRACRPQSQAKGRK